MECRICLETDETVIRPCLCKGTAGGVHNKCLEKWLEESGKNSCEICRADYHRESVCSYQPWKYIKNYCNLSVPMDFQTIHKKMAVQIFFLTCVSFCIVPVTAYMLTSVISTMIVVVMACGFQMAYPETDVKLHNIIPVWKCAFSFPFICAVLVQQLSVQEDCEVACWSHSHTSCNAVCPVYGAFYRQEELMSTSIIYDMAQVAVLLCIRSFVLCFVYMRRLKFSSLPANRTLGIPSSDEERNPLLSTESSTGSATGMENSSSVESV